MLVTVNNRLKSEIEIVHDLLCHPILYFLLIARITGLNTLTLYRFSDIQNILNRTFLLHGDRENTIRATSNYYVTRLMIL